MHTARKNVFFWLGVAVLPVFWAWFTLARGFTARQRGGAFGWLGLWGAWLWLQREALLEQAWWVALAYPVILGWLAVALGVWLFFRITIPSNTVSDWVILSFMLWAVLPTHPLPYLFASRLGHPFDPAWLLPLALLMLAHLLLDPLSDVLKRAATALHR